MSHWLILAVGFVPAGIGLAGLVMLATGGVAG